MEPTSKPFLLKRWEWAPILIGVVISPIGYALANRNPPLPEAWRWVSTAAGVAGVLIIAIGLSCWLHRVIEWKRESKK